MAKRRLTEGEALERIRRERDPGGGAIVDMRIDFEAPDGELILSCGGRWDRQMDDFDGDAEDAVVVRGHAGQVPAIRWWAGWLGVHAWRRDHPPELPTDEEMERMVFPADEALSALHAGGRRSGKTWIDVAFDASYAVQFPNALVWIVNPSDEAHDEVRRYMADLLSPDWIASETAEGWWLINGSEIRLRSGYTGADPDAIKKGEAHLIHLNEGQKMAERVFVVARGAISDRSGLVLISANPPVEAKDQQWVADFAAEASAGRRAAHYIHFNPLDNPFINRRALLELRRETDERTYRIEVLGEFLPPEDSVAYNWLRTPGGNERARPLADDPKWIDVTEAFLRQEEEGEGFTHLIGMDFQIHPWCGGPVFKLYAPRSEEPTRKNVVMWGVGEVVVEGDEEAWCDEARQSYDPDATLLIGDATGEYQHTRRGKADAPPPEWKGKGSFDIIRSGGFMHIVPPSRRIRRKNLDVIDRVRAFTSQICSSTQNRRLFMDPDLCPLTTKSIREWPTVHGKPSRTHEAAHLGDATSYAVVRLFPRIFRSGNTPPVAPKGNDVETVAKPSFLGPPPRAPRTPKKRPGRGLW